MVLLAVEESEVTPGVLGLVVVALLIAATVFLLRSLNKQLKRVNFEERPPAGAEPSSDRSAVTPPPARSPRSGPAPEQHDPPSPP